MLDIIMLNIIKECHYAECNGPTTTTATAATAATPITSAKVTKVKTGCTAKAYPSVWLSMVLQHKLKHYNGLRGRPWIAYRSGRINTMDLLVLANSDQLHFIVKIYFLQNNLS
jgi:hypothetical protein